MSASFPMLPLSSRSPATAALSAGKPSMVFARFNHRQWADKPDHIKSPATAALISVARKPMNSAFMPSLARSCAAAGRDRPDPAELNPHRREVREPGQGVDRQQLRPRATGSAGIGLPLLELQVRDVLVGRELEAEQVADLAALGRIDAEQERDRCEHPAEDLVRASGPVVERRPRMMSKSAMNAMNAISMAATFSASHRPSFTPAAAASIDVARRASRR